MEMQIKTLSPKGFEVTFIAEMEDRHKALEVLPLFEVELQQHGYEPLAGHPAPVAPRPNGELWFPAAELLATVDNGKTYWRVKGGEFRKYGVTIYPEVLEAAGFDFDQLDPLRPMNLDGWRAIYITKDNGKPKKVIELAPPPNFNPDYKG